MGSTAEELEEKSRATWARPGADTALGKLELELLRISAAELCEPRVRVELVLEDARALLELVTPSSIRLKLVATGLGSRRLDGVPLAIQALQEAEERLVRARCPESAHAALLGAALAAREELRAACQWNLRARDVASSLARITDSSAWDELVIDLRELAQLVEQHEEHFFGDRTFTPGDGARRATELAVRLGELGDALALEHVQPHVIALRDRAFTHLVDLLDEIRAAGRYAFRGERQARAFVCELAARRPRSVLDSWLSPEVP